MKIWRLYKYHSINGSGNPFAPINIKTGEYSLKAEFQELIPIGYTYFELGRYENKQNDFVITSRKPVSKYWKYVPKPLRKRFFKIL